jgi:type IV pilus assembly protein PilY1
MVGAQPDPLQNVGWYFNLPESGERVVSDVQIRAGRLTLISYVAATSTCGISGHSWFMALDPCTGGRLQEAYFDVNGDRQFDDQDLVNIGTPENPILVTPLALKKDGKVEMPTYLIDGGIEKIIFPGNDGTPGGGGGGGDDDDDDDDDDGKAPDTGMTYWRVLRK